MGIDSSGVTSVHKTAYVAIGFVVALFGLLFMLQGLGAVEGSPMSNTMTWSILGPLIALGGLAFALYGWFGGRSR
jgi:hypothetical protein